MWEKDRQSRILPQAGPRCTLFRGFHDRRAVGLPASQTARSNAQRSLLCGLDPALPVLAALISLRKIAQRFF